MSPSHKKGKDDQLQEAGLFLQSKLKPQSASSPVAYGYCTAVELHCVFYNGESKAGASNFTGPAFVYPVEPLEQAWEFCRINATAVIFK